MPQSIPCMPVHGHVGTHTRVVTFGSSLTSAGGEEGGFGSLYLSVTQMLNDVYRDCAYARVPHFTTGVSLLKIASYLPFSPPSAAPFSPLCLCRLRGSFCGRRRSSTRHDWGTSHRLVWMQNIPTFGPMIQTHASTRGERNNSQKTCTMN